METNIKVNLKKEKWKDMGFIPIKLIANIKEKTFKIRKMELSIKEDGKMIRNMVKVSIQTKMENLKEVFGIMEK